MAENGKPAGPTDELGTAAAAGTLPILGGGVLPWSTITEDRETAPDLIWPNSVDVYRRMQNDAQVKGLLLATTLPIRRYRWEIDPNGAKPEVVDHVASSLNLPIRGQEPKPRRERGRFNHDRHLAHALRALPYGHFYFEQVGEIGSDGLWHLRKLATRPPRTISDIELAPDGGLAAIRQPYFGAGSDGIGGVRLDVSRLLAFIWEPEDDADWIGRSVIRACHPNYALKDRLLRIDATKHERNAMGIPWFDVGPDGTDKQVQELAQIATQIRAGEYMGGAGPGKLRIAGVEGFLPETIPSVRYHDEQMSKAFLLLFFDLGKTETGSRALGSEFIDWYAEGQGAIADWYAVTMNAYQIEDEVEINWGPDEQPPRLTYTRTESAELAISDFVAAVGAGLIAVDDELRAVFAERFGLPAPAAGAEPPPPPEPEPEPTPGGALARLRARGWR